MLNLAAAGRSAAPASNAYTASDVPNWPGTKANVIATNFLQSQSIQSMTTKSRGATATQISTTSSACAVASIARSPRAVRGSREEKRMMRLMRAADRALYNAKADGRE
jgi:GGDEF domain-containing protein